MLLHAGDKVVVYDRDAYEVFPEGTKEVTTEAWGDAQETAIPDCTSVAEVMRAEWAGSWFRCPRCESRQRAGVLRCLAPHCGMVFDDVAEKMRQIVAEKQAGPTSAPDPLTRRRRSTGAKKARVGDLPSEALVAQETRLRGAARRGRSVCPRVRQRDDVTTSGVQFLVRG